VAVLAVVPIERSPGQFSDRGAFTEGVVDRLPASSASAEISERMPAWMRAPIVKRTPARRQKSITFR
jgi:hypothetical protein